MSLNNFPRGRTAIVAGATYGIGEAPGYDSLDLAALASLKALDMAGLQPKDVDGLFIVLPNDPFSHLSMAQYFGIHPKVMDNNRTGGSSFQIHAHYAALALAAGECDVALIAYGSNLRTSAGKFASTLRPSIYQAPYKPMIPVSAYALAAARHMHQFGTTREQLAEVAVAARAWANLNPDAFARGPLAVGDCLASRMISDPLTKHDCCLVTDGAAAVVMTRADRAKDHARRPAYLLGAGSATTHSEIASIPDLTVTAAVELWKTRFRARPRQALRHRRRRALRRVYDHHDSLSGRFGILPKGRRRTVRRKRRDRSEGKARGQHERRRSLLCPSRHVRAVHHGRGDGADHGAGGRTSGRRC